MSKKFPIAPFSGIVFSLNPELIPNDAAQAISNYNVEDGSLAVRFGYRNIITHQGSFSAVWGLDYLRGFTSAGVEKEEYVSFEALGGNTKPFSRDPVTGVVTEIKNGTTTLNQNASSWRGIVFNDQSYFFNPNQTNSVARHAIGDATSWTELVPPVLPIPPVWTSAQITPVSSTGWHSATAAGTGNYSATTNNDTSLTVTFATGNKKDATMTFTVTPSTMGVQDLTNNDIVEFTLNMATSVGFKVDATSLRMDVINNDATPITFPCTATFTQILDTDNLLVQFYWDNKFSDFELGLTKVRLVTQAALTSTAAIIYNNGTAGVGATLTRGENGVLGNIDGVAAIVGDRLLIKSQAVATQNGIYCLSEDTEILTREGWKTHAEVAVGTEVLTYNLKTGKNEWQGLNSVHVFPVKDCPMMRLKIKGHDSLSTLNHRWITKNQRSQKQRVTLSEDLTINTGILKAAPCSSVPTEKFYSDELVELMAWFFTEGHIRKNNRKDDGTQVLSTCVRIAQSALVNPVEVDRIRCVLTEVFGPDSGSRKKGGYRPTAPAWHERSNSNGRGLTSFDLNCAAGKVLCDLAPDRVVPLGFIHQLTHDQLELFIEVALDADGHTSKMGQRAIAQKDSRRLDAIQMAATLLGIPTTTYKATGDQVALGLNHSLTTCPHKEVVSYTGNVWCPSTPNGTWVARRNGTVYITGNTVTSVGSGGTPYILTRAADADEAKDYLTTQKVYPTAGSVSTNLVYDCGSTTVVLGTTNLVFTVEGSPDTRGRHYFADIAKFKFYLNDTAPGATANNQLNISLPRYRRADTMEGWTISKTGLQFGYTEYNSTADFESDIASVAIPRANFISIRTGDVSGTGTPTGTGQGNINTLSFPASVPAGVDYFRIYYKATDGVWHRVGQQLVASTTFQIYNSDLETLNTGNAPALTPFTFKTDNCISACTFKGAWAVWGYKGGFQNVRHSRIGLPINQASGQDLTDDFDRGATFGLFGDDPVTMLESGDALIVFGNRGVYAQEDTNGSPSGMTPIKRVPKSKGIANQFCAVRWADDSGNPSVVWMNPQGDIEHLLTQQQLTGDTGELIDELFGAPVRGVMQSLATLQSLSDFSSARMAVDEATDTLRVYLGVYAMVLSKPRLIDSKRQWQIYKYVANVSYVAFSTQRRMRWIRSTGEFDESDWNSVSGAYIAGTLRDGGIAMPSNSIYWQSKTFKYTEPMRVNSVNVERETIANTPTITCYSSRIPSGTAIVTTTNKRFIRFPFTQQGWEHSFKISGTEGDGKILNLSIELFGPLGSKELS